MTRSGNHDTRPNGLLSGGGLQYNCRPMSDSSNTLVFPLRRPRIEPVDGGALRLAAPAKINLNLLVGGRQDDGFHTLDSYVAKITLYDELTLRRRRDARITLACSGADCGDEDRNLAVLAARALAGEADVGGVDIDLVKRIPPGAGLGGGSSDAAAVLWGLRRLWRLELGDEDLAAVATSLGSDVPLFLAPAAVRMTGRGQHVEPADVHPFFALLFMPGIHCGTGEVYRAFDAAGGGTIGEQLAPSVLTAAPSGWRGLLRNDLASAAERIAPPLEELRRSIAERTRLPVCLTGSGSAMFILCDSPDEAAAASAALDETQRAICIPVSSNTW